MTPYPPDTSPEQDDPPTTWQPDLTLRRIVCAANRHRPTGRIICGPRHWDRTMRQQRHPGETFDQWDDGFIDQFGIWLTRKEAWIVAVEKGQIIREVNTPPGTLYSEHLY